MVTEDIYEKVTKYLEEEKILFIKVPVIQYAQITKDYWKNNTNLLTASKLNIFNLTQFDKVVYVDADAIFLKNTDTLFNYPNMAMYDANDGTHTGFSGLFVCEPKLHDIETYLELLNNTTYPMLDGDLLGQEWSKFKTDSNYRIPFTYFINTTWEDLDEAKKYDKLIGFHFCYHYKPWNYISLEEFLKDYTKELKHYSKLREIIVQFYIDDYTLPIRNKYPELFQ